MEYTKGPWKVDEAPDLPLGVIMDDEDGLGICTVEPCYTTEGEALANARLIAAAPELYEACCQMRIFIQEWKDVLLTNMTANMLLQETHKLNPAIAKAES